LKDPGRREGAGKAKGKTLNLKQKTLRMQQVSLRNMVTRGGAGPGSDIKQGEGGKEVDSNQEISKKRKPLLEASKHPENG